MRHYFFKPSVIYIRLALVGAFLLLLAIIVSGLLGGPPIFISILGLGCLCGGGIPLLIHYTDQPTDQQYANWVIERSQPLYKTALQRLHIDESQCESIIEVEGGISSLLQLTKKFPEKEIVVKRLLNGFRHYSINVSMHIFLMKDEIAIYSGYINALAQKERFEDADHYYYEDIVAVSTSGPIYTFWDGSSEKEIQMQGFLVRANNGDVVGTDYATRITLQYGENRVQVQGVDNVVPALLHLLRDHKVSAVEAHQITKDIL